MAAILFFIGCPKSTATGSQSDKRFSIYRVHKQYPAEGNNVNLRTAVAAIMYYWYKNYIKMDSQSDKRFSSYRVHEQYPPWGTM